MSFWHRGLDQDSQEVILKSLLYTVHDIDTVQVTGDVAVAETLIADLRLAVKTASGSGKAAMIAPEAWSPVLACLSDAFLDDGDLRDELNADQWDLAERICDDLS